jgi:hypothetical protein
MDIKAKADFLLSHFSHTFCWLCAVKNGRLKVQASKTSRIASARSLASRESVNYCRHYQIQLKINAN